MDLAACLDGAPEDAKSACAALQYNSVILVMLGVGHTGLADKSAVYIPDPAILPHRVCYMSYFSPHNAPQGSPPTWWPKSPCRRATPLLSGQRGRAGWPGGQGRERALRHQPARNHRQPGPAHQACLRGLRPRLPEQPGARSTQWLDGLGLYTCGRFGSFEYLNMDQCLERARDLAGELNKE